MESVWDYPRPPRVEASMRRIRVEFAGEVVAETTRAFRVLETSHPPVFYLPPEDVRRELLRPSRRRTWCEFKGEAAYYDLAAAGREVRDAAWYYPAPSPGYEAIRDHVAFYPGRVDAAWVDGERVQAQTGDFYGGWITVDIEGPFKGGPGTAAW
jgi:uncharacterized protein (DUF427 family)